MILPITLYGNPILRKVAKNIDQDYEGLNDLIDNMFETMYKSEGVGLAAPQINKSIRLFVIDASPFEEDAPELKGFKKVFINPQIIEYSDETDLFNEGCLSIPSIREDVERPVKIKIKYQDENFNNYEDEWDGIKARIVQHEYDHLDGKMFVDKLPALKKRLIKSKLNAILKGKTTPNYKIVPNKK